MPERGLADDELIDDSERDRFADVAGTPGDVDRDPETTGRSTSDHPRRAR